MTVADGSILRVVASMLWTDGNVNQNIFNCRITDTGAPWAEQDVIDDLEDWLDNMYLNLATAMVDAIDGNEVVAYKWDVAGQDWDEVSSQAWTWNPSNGGEQLPRGTAPLVRLWTEDPDVQGKKYMPGAVEANLEDGLYISSFLVELLAFAADWYLPFTGAATGGTFTPGIWSVVGKVFEAGIDHIAVSAIPAYQRRRKRNVGI
jgi:hypothetical protein